MIDTEERRRAREKCERLLRLPSVLGVLEDELRQQGFAGPTDVPKLVLLCLYTRFLEKPVSLVIKGPSGSGKSHALHAGLQFAPREAFEEFSGMSEKALLYMNDLNLKHRYLVIGEAAGLSDGAGRAFLRQLLSEGTVRYATVQKTSDGLVGQELRPIEGPTGLIMTTTANALHLEDESRMLSYHLDESFERIREALVSQALGLKSIRRPLDTEPWYSLHDFVGSGNVSVDIPYAEVLANKLPLSHFKVMRDFPHVLSLIQAHALMHQCGRHQGEAGHVVATLEDYRAVYDLVASPLAQGLEAAVSEQVRGVVEAVRALLKTEQPIPLWETQGVSQVQLSEALDRDQSVISRNVRKAVEQGFLKNLSPGQGREARLVIGERKLPSGTVLPSPEELQNEMNPPARVRTFMPF
ncbi:hypothetical protein BH10PSE9_BH10PSE9_00590 [soil metagenome]